MTSVNTELIDNSGDNVPRSIGSCSQSITPISKKGKKKQKYKDLLKMAMTCERTDDEITNAHKRKIESSTGGGAFKKIEKI